jgi:hypothetical protein
MHFFFIEPICGQNMLSVPGCLLLGYNVLGIDFFAADVLCIAKQIREIQ